MNRKTRVPTLLAMGLGALTVGCGDNPASTEPAGKLIPVSNFHHAVDNGPTLDLKDWKYFPSGIGIRQNAAALPLSDRSVDYGLALRTAALKLKGDLPTMAEIDRLQAAVASGDPGAVYAQLVESYVNAPTFARQMMQFWRNTLRQGGAPISGTFQETTMVKQVDLESAPAFMAYLTVNGLDMMRAFTEDRNNCGVFDAATNQLSVTECYRGDRAAAQGLAMPGNGVMPGAQAGILTNPGFMAQWYSNMGFRRARLIQELFACTRMPAEFREKPEQIGAYIYSSPWAIDSVPNAGKAPDVNALLADRNKANAYRTPPPPGTADSIKKEFVDFATACQGCHSTMNHRAALFAVFDSVGFSSVTSWNANAKFNVVTPVSFSPFTTLREYIFPGATPAWKFQKPATSFQEFGQHMAKDPEVHRCMIGRVWNHAYSRDDIVEALALVPPQVTQDLVKYFSDNGFNLKKTILKLYTDANYIRF